MVPFLSAMMKSVDSIAYNVAIAASCMLKQAVYFARIFLFFPFPFSPSPAINELVVLVPVHVESAAQCH